MDSQHRQSAEVTMVVLAVCKHTSETESGFAYRVKELEGLCEAAGGVVKTTIVQERPDVDARTYLGSGKIEEIADAAASVDADVVVFDAELSPGQVRNIEARVPCRVIDRTQLILDIFALRARSKSGRLQVEIAQLQYWLPRLTGHGREMSRLGGGIGTRGPGETKLETDRRRIRDRISRLRQELRNLGRTRALQRDKRNRNVPVVALVGYTNAGKTTLLQRWTSDKSATSASPGENRLFDTLDPLARRVRSGATKEIVLLDTVGFVQDLPHLLVDAFKSTLEEVTAADLIVHVVDGSRETSRCMQTTYEVLGKLNALDRPIVTFFNKMDLADERPGPDVRAETTLYGSAVGGDGIPELYEVVDKMLRMDQVVMTVEGPAVSKPFWDLVGTHGRAVKTEELENGWVRVSLAVERRNAGWLREAFDRAANAAAIVKEPEGNPGEEWSSSTW